MDKDETISYPEPAKDWFITFRDFLMIIKTFVTFIQGDHNNWLIQTDK